MKCYIFCSAPIEDYGYLEELDYKSAYIICADGGYAHTQKLGLVPDLWIGDGDSLTSAQLCAKKTLTLPVKKDNTDTDVAVMEALKLGYRDITILGALGGRLDHEFSHFCLLKKITDAGGKGTLLNDKNEITMSNKPFAVYPDGKKYISFFPFGGVVTDFSVRGLCYEAEGMTLYPGEVQASSNCFCGEAPGKIAFSSGCLLVIKSKD